VQVLLAHPSPAARDAVAAALLAAGYAVQAVEDAQAALAAAREQPVDVVLLDHRLAGPDAGLVRRIKADPVAFTTNIVLIAPRDGVGLGLPAGPDAGIHDVLLEPFEPAEAVVRVLAAARTKALRDELLQQARRLEVSLFEDALTGLYNRRFVMTQLGALISGARRHGRPLSVAMIDVDRFKSFNDNYGHAVGDRVLQAVAAALHDRMRAEDYLGRWGGEEFLALLPDTDEDAAGPIAERLRSTVDAVRVPTSGEMLAVTVSLGWATWELDEDVDSLVHRADEALYAAKEAGRDRVRPAATLRRRV
jgi:two-component system cell cycle response regulator